MRTILIAALAALSLSGAAKAVDIEEGAWGCTISIWKSGWTWYSNEGSLKCAADTVNAMNWLSNTFTSNTDKFNEIVDHINDVDGSTGMLVRAGSGGVGTVQRDGVIVKYNNLLDSNEAMSSKLMERYNIITDLCDTLEDNSVDLTSDQQEICNAYY